MITEENLHPCAESEQGVWGIKPPLDLRVNAALRSERKVKAQRAAPPISN